MDFKTFLTESKSKLSKLGKEYLEIASDTTKKHTHEVFSYAYKLTTMYKTVEEVENKLIELSKIQPNKYRVAYLVAARHARNMIS